MDDYGLNFGDPGGDGFDMNAFIEEDQQQLRREDDLTPPASPESRRPRNDNSRSPLHQVRRRDRSRSRDRAEERQPSRAVTLSAAKLTLWELLTRGTLTMETLMSIRLPLGDLEEAQEQDNVDEEELLEASHAFVDVSARAIAHPAFESEEDICAAIEANYRGAPPTHAPAGLNEDLIDALNRLYLLFGGDSYRLFPFPVIAALSMLRFPVANGLAIKRQAREYIVALSRLQIWIESTSGVQSANRQRVVFLYSQIANRIRALQDMRLAAYASSAHSRLDPTTSFLHISDGIIRDGRALHALPFGNLARGLEMFFTECARQGLKLKGDTVYRPVVRDGVFLNAYEKWIKTIGGKELSNLSTLLRHFPGGAMLHPGWDQIVAKMPQNIEKHIQAYGSTHLAQITSVETLYSFRNGVYDSRSDEFYKHSDAGIPGLADRVFPDLSFREEIMDDRWRDPLRFYETKEPPRYFVMMKELAPEFFNMIAYQYPEKKSSPDGAPYSTYKDQEEVLKMIFVFIGRLLFELGMIDVGFEKFVCLIGLAGTGKSKLMDLLRFIIPNSCDLPAVPEEKFFAQDIPGTEIIFADEVTQNWKLNPQWLLQVTCSRGYAGDQKLSNAVKHESVVNWVATQPMFIAGNSFPDLPDESGQICRRLFALLYDRVVGESMKDPGLYDKIKNSLDVIIVGLCRHYLASTRCMPMDATIDQYIHEDLIRDRTAMLKTNNVVRKFLSQDSTNQIVTFDRKGALSDMYMPVDVLVNEFCSFKGGRNAEMTDAEWSQIVHITGIAPVVFQEGDNRNRSVSRGNCPTYDLLPINNGVFGASTGGISIRYPEFSHAQYKLKNQIWTFDATLSESSFVHGICLNYNKSYRLQKNDRLPRDPGGQVAPETSAEYNSLTQCRKLIQFERSRYTTDEEKAYAKAMRTALEKSHSRADAKRRAEEKQENEGERTKATMLEVVAASEREDGELFSKLDEYVIDALIGKRNGGERIQGVFEVGGAIQNGAKMVFGMVDAKQAGEGIYRALRVSSEFKRHMRVEFYGLVARVARYAREERGIKEKRALKFLADELAKFYSQYWQNSPFNKTDRS